MTNQPDTSDRPRPSTVVPGPVRHLLGLEGLDRETIDRYLTMSVRMREVLDRDIKKVPTLRGKSVINAFFENSTRTRMSFEYAGKVLSADVMNFSASSSSLKKGETLLDTARTLQAMRPDIIVVRHGASGAPHMLAKYLDCQVVNAGDGVHEHPTQGLLDLLTVRQHKGAIDGLDVTIVGDIAHSRVARSAIFGFITMGARVRVAGPRTMLPLGIEELGVEAFDRVEPAIEGADVVMMLRIQRERLGSAPLFPSLREYSRVFGLNRERLRLTKESALVMHPGPINRGVEIDPEVADGPWSVILDQVTNGVALRMSVLYLLATGRWEADTDA